VRRKGRIQHYLVLELCRKIRATAAALGVTESSVTEAALREYFDREGTDKDWLARRLDLIARSSGQIQGSVDRACARVQSDVDLLLDALGVFVRYLFLPAMIKPGPDHEQRIEAAYQGFLRRVFDQNRDSGKFKREVRDAGAGIAARGPNPTSGGR
jgi:hypothetical protein